ncbi:hypothetical protein LL072_08015 [Lactobacillus delbrueckii subsp. lactis DSM 20072]|nr:hypothetical protein LL072_08015 [Lactobacillus delbrueckii subsp. lactis DSM 20072]
MRLSVKYIIDVINANPGLPHISRSNYYYQTHKPDKASGNQKLINYPLGTVVVLSCGCAFSDGHQL